MDLTYIAIAVIVTVAIMSTVFVVVQSKRKGEVGIPWVKIRPILTEAFGEVMTLIKDKNHGYQTIEDFAVNFIKNKIDEANFIGNAEKNLLSEDLIRSVVAPRLKELHSKEQSK